VNVVGVRRRTGDLEAAALIDRDVHEHAARPHPLHHLAGDEPGRVGAGHEDRADDEVRARDRIRDRLVRGGQRPHGGTVAVVERPERIHRAVEGGDRRVHADGVAGRTRSRDACPEDDDLGRGRADDAAHEHSRTTGGGREQVRADDGRHPPRDLGHRREQGQSPGRVLDRLVGDRRRARLEQALGERAVGGEVQVGEQDLPGAQVVVLLGPGLLDLHDQVRGPRLGGGVDDPRAGDRVVVVMDPGGEPGPGLDEDLTPGRDELGHPRCSQADPTLVVEHLRRYSDAHDALRSPRTIYRPPTRSVPTSREGCGG
jgi:hypothetical protein